VKTFDVLDMLIDIGLALKVCDEISAMETSFDDLNLLGLLTGHLSLRHLRENLQMSARGFRSNNSPFLQLLNKVFQPYTIDN
jgi:hypothetical protein